MQTVPKYLEIMKNHLLWEKLLDFWEHFNNSLENNRIPDGFDYFMSEILIMQRPTNRFKGRLIDWFPAGRAPGHDPIPVF